jgi:hypothetical protein
MTKKWISDGRSRKTKKAVALHIELRREVDQIKLDAIPTKRQRHAQHRHDMGYVA